MLSLNIAKTNVVISEEAAANVGLMQTAVDVSKHLEAVITDWSFFSLQGIKELNPSQLEIRLINDVIAALCVGSPKFSEQLLTNVFANYAFYPEFVNKILQFSVSEMTFRNIDTEGLKLTYQLDELEETGVLEIHFAKTDKQSKVEFSLPAGWLLSQGEQKIVNELLEVIHSAAGTESKVEILAVMIREIIDAMTASNSAANLDVLSRIEIAVEDQSGCHFKLAEDFSSRAYLEFSQEYGSVVTHVFQSAPAKVAA